MSLGNLELFRPVPFIWFLCLPLFRYLQDIYKVDENGQVTLNGAAAPNVNGIVFKGDHGDSRGLNFTQNFEHFGWWSCVIGYGEDDLLHLGTFKINEENDFPKDIRLPADNIEVKLYYLNGSPIDQIVQFCPKAILVPN